MKFYQISVLFFAGVLQGLWAEPVGTEECMKMTRPGIEECASLTPQQIQEKNLHHRYCFHRQDRCIKKKNRNDQNPFPRQ
jgi:hypothetical protein